MLRTAIFLVTAAALGAPLAAHAEDYAGGAIKTMDGAGGGILTDAKGMALYIFDKDAKGMSNCYDDCAVKWPPLMAEASAKADGEFTLVARKDGSMQWAHDGMPLYLWQNDKKPGDMTGDGVGGVWHVAKD
jgi:predicted lipoprotein with Yx(FWY)xxD motif